MIHQKGMGFSLGARIAKGKPISNIALRENEVLYIADIGPTISLLLNLGVM